MINVNNTESDCIRNNEKSFNYRDVLYNEAVVISSIYAIFGILWIALSDTILEYIIRDIELYKHFQTYKGWFYILITTLMVYLLIRSRMKLLKKENEKTLKAYAKLSTAHDELMVIKTELTRQKELTERIVNEAPVFIITHDDERIISFNPFALKSTGYTYDEIVNKNWTDLLVPADYLMHVRGILHRIKTEQLALDYEFPIIAKDGSYINILWCTNLIHASEGQSYFVTFGADINERKRYEDKIKHLAFYDTLTGMPNRAMFESEINRHLNLKLSGDHFMIAYIDIDNFKNINDSMGHQVGDLFLTYLGDRLKTEINEPSIVARLGGDEFAILFLHMTKEEVMDKIETIRNRVSKTWTIENHQFYISMSIGIVEYPYDGTNSTTLLKNADIAMYCAKREGKNRVLFYKEEINDYHTKQLKMISNLQYGIDEEQFVLYYQPQIDLKTGEILGVEALVRWIHPEDGFIPPSDFIPLAEESGQIFKLERWIIKKALDQKKVWEELGFTDLVLSINLSGKTLTSTINFEEIERIIATATVDYDKVMIEITETANISDMDIVITHLNLLRKYGIKVALDDFGTGYSSLNYLKMFPINIIKLDRSFIKAINENGVDVLLIKNILSLAHDLEFEVIAEGIETREQLGFLRDNYCEAGQGYLFSKPKPIEELNHLLQENYKFED